MRALESVRAYGLILRRMMPVVKRRLAENLNAGYKIAGYFCCLTD